MTAKRVLDEGLIYEILSVVEEIPRGCVATYGQIAGLIGREKNSRLVNHAGRLVPGWREQAELLRREGVPMKDEDHVDLKKCRWHF